MPKLTILFWNINGSSQEDLLKLIVHQYNVGVVVLAESEISEDDLAKEISTRKKHFYPSVGVSAKLSIVSQFKPPHLEAIEDDLGVAIRQITVAPNKQLLLVAVHLISKAFYDETDQSACSHDLAGLVRSAEQKVRHQKTVVIGDLNMNPFDNGVVSASGLHAIGARQIVASRRTRRVRDRELPMFYNPMWNFLGDERNELPATYFFDYTGHERNYFWNTIDQVLLRPDILYAFQFKKLKVLTSIGNTSLLNTNKIPDSVTYSDHLPLLLTLNL